ncbi:Nitroreductase family protein, partial [Actinokineospora terrae]
MCRWQPEGLQVGLPDRHQWVRIPPALFGLLDSAGEWTDLDAVCAKVPAADASQARAALDKMVDLGILVTEEVETPVLWRYWGAVARRFHTDARDANYLVDSPERDAEASAIAADGAPPPVFKDYPGARVVMLPRAPLPLRMPVETVFTSRRTHRRFSAEPVSLDQLGTLLFYAFGPQRFLDGGVFGPQQARVSASAGGRHEVEAYLAVYNVDGVPPGLYHYS